MNAPLDLAEWLDWLWLHVCRYPSQFPQGSDDFAREAAELVASDMTEEYWNMRGDLERQAGKEFDDDWHLVEHFVDRDNLLSELHDRLDKAGFPGDAGDALGHVLARLEEAETELQALKAPAGLVYDL